MLLRWSKNLHDTSKLLLFILAWENWIASIKLSQDTPKTPHVNWHAIRQAKNYFGGAIEPTLDVRIHLFALKAARPKVDDPDFRSHRMDHENVLRFQIAMNDLLGTKKDQAAQYLLRETTNKLQRKALEVMGLDEFVEVHPKQFC